MVLPLVYAAILSPLAILNVLNADGRATFDQVLFHEHTIDAIARTWPIAILTFPDHFVAMTPGYHWVLGGVARLTGMGDPGLRTVGLALSASIFAGFGLLLARRCGPALAALLVSPLMASVYVANSSAWMLADNAGWFWVYLLAIAAVFGRPSLRWSVLVGAGLLLAVWTRQNLLFLALPLWAAAWLREAPAGPDSTNPLVGMPRRAMNLLPLAIATLPAIGTLAYLYSIWNGLVPYEFQGQYDGVNPSNMPLQLVMVAGLGFFFIPALLGVGEPGWRAEVVARLRRAAPWMIVAAVLAGFVSALVPTTSDPKAGRAGLIWSTASKLDPLGPIGDCNPLVVLGAMAGGVMLVLILASVPSRRRWILGALFAGFAVAQVASSEVWQRYHEPFALLFLAISTATAVAHRAPAWRRPPLAQGGPIALLAVALALISAIVLWNREINPWRNGASPTPFSSLLPDPPANGPNDSGEQPE
ncbi:MAG: hypothetical protein RIE77_11970 [Phycisphaerales bacterium]